MKILAIESSAKAVSAALCEDAFLLAEAYQNNGLTHSTTLLPLCEQLLRSAGTALRDVGLIACAQGPGSFTGLRIGLSTAKGLAWADELPCMGVSTLEAMAWNAAAVPGILCCCMDARRGQVYNALFESDGAGGLVRLTEDRAISAGALLEEKKQRGVPYFLIGDGALLCYNAGREQASGLTLAPENLRYQSAWGVARAALRKLETEQPVSGAALEARYLRLSQAERERKERLAREQSNL